MSWMAAATVASGILGFGSKKSADSTNAQLTREANAQAAQEAKNARGFNKHMVLSGRRFDAGQAREARAWNRTQIVEARKWDKTQVADQRRFETRQTIAAEKRGERRAARDRDDHREYNDPAAMRARLEAAGLNPMGLVGDQSGGFVSSGGAFVPSSVSGARSGAASAIGATSATASATPAHVFAQQVSAANPFGDALVDAASAYSQARALEQEQALLQTQLDLDS